MESGDEQINTTSTNSTSIRTLGLLAGRPLVGVAIAFILGVALYARLPLMVPLWIMVVLLSLATAWWLANRPLLSTAAILLATNILGVAMAQLHASQYPANHIAHFTGDTRRLGQLELKLVDLPRIYAPTFGQAFPLPPRQMTIADVVAIRTWDGWEPAQGRVLVQIAEPNPLLKAGQRVRAFGMIDRPAASMNPGQFDWAGYYRQQRVTASFQIPHASNLTILDEGTPTLRQRWCAYTRAKLADGFTADQSLDHALLQALVLGDSDPELNDVQEQFRRTGTSHHLAISGMHIAIMGGVVFIIARLLRLPPRWGWGLAMVFVICYGLAALPSPPVMRSVLMWLVLGLGILWRRGINFLQVLALVVVAMLMYEPLDLFNAGFQLSFGVVLGLIVLTAPMTRALGLAGRERLDEKTPVEVTRWALRAAGYIDRQVILVFVAGVVAFFVSMPIVATHFSQLNPWAILASIVMGPLVVVSLIGGALKICFTILWPGMAWFWAWVSQWPVVGMRGLVEWLSRAPWGDVPVPAPPWWLVVVFYITLLLFAVPWRQRSARLLTGLAHLATLGIMLFLPYASTVVPQQVAGSLRVTLLAVGAGQCAIVEPPSGRTTVLDAGSLSLADPVRRAIAPFLRQRGITQLDTIAVSHANSDHFSAVAELLEAYGVREVLTAPRFAQVMANNPSGIEMLASLKRNQRPPTVVMPGHVMPLGSETTLKVLWAPDEAGLTANDESMVLLLTHAGTRILFTGDIQEAAMKRLLATPEVIRADIMVAPHHGSSEPITPAFLRAVSPKIIVASNGRTLSGKHLRFDDMARGTPLLRTHASGAITLHVDQDGRYRIETHLPVREAIKTN